MITQSESRSLLPVVVRDYLSMLVCCAVLMESAAAQDVFRVRIGRECQKLSGVDRVGDLDGDGLVEYVIGAASWCAGFGPITPSGVVQVLSGATGAPALPALLHFGDHNQFGYHVAGVGDFDGDGVPDFAQSDPNVGIAFWGEASVFSGATGMRLAVRRGGEPWPFQMFGWKLVPLGDMDGDGHAEIAVRDRGGNGWWRVLTWPDLEQDPVLPSYFPVFGSFPDLNGDGVMEYLTAAPGGFNGEGVVIVRDGVTWNIIWRSLGPGPLAGMGISAAQVSDWDGDGHADLVVGMRYSNQDINGHCHDFLTTPPGWRGAIALLSGIDGTYLLQSPGSRHPIFTATPTTQETCYFEGLSSGPDVNGDGFDDVLARFTRTHAHLHGSQVLDPCDFLGNQAGLIPVVEVISGRTLQTLWRVYPAHDHAILGDLNGDALAEWAVGYFGTGCNNEGRITIYEGAVGDAERTCPANVNSTGLPARLELDGPISLSNNELLLVCDQAPPGELGFFFYGPDLVQLPVGDGVLCAGGGGIGVVRTGGPVLVGPDGSAVEAVDLTSAPFSGGPHAWIPGSTWTVQFGFRDAASPGPAGYNLSDAVRVTPVP